MAKKASPALIGGFTVGALILAVAGLFLFGSGKFFKDTTPCVMYFDGSVKGLTVGAPVTFKGVKVGSVSDIDLIGDMENASFQVPVLVDINRDTIMRVREGKRGTEYLASDTKRGIKLLVDKGLRARLQMRSVVTGMLEISLDLYPNTTASLKDKLGKYPEIPTIPSGLAQFSETLENLPLNEVVTTLLETLKATKELIGSSQIPEAVKSANRTLEEMTKLVQQTSVQVETLSKRTDETLKELSTTMRNVDKQTASVAADIAETAKSLRATLEQAKVSLATVQTIAAENSPERVRLNKALDDISRAARSVDTLTEYLDRHPEALLRGKGGN